MTEFIAGAEGTLKELTELVEECSSKFIECMKFYKFVPKMGKLEDAKPEDFFCFWSPFCYDYKNLWKKEQLRIQKETLIKERLLLKKKKESLQNVEVKKTPAGGLKAKLQRRKTKTSSVSAPVQEDRKEADAQEPESLKAKLLRRKSKKSSDSAAPLEPGPETGEVERKESLQETPRPGGLKAKLQQRKIRQAAESASVCDNKEAEEEQDEY